MASASVGGGSSVNGARASAASSSAGAPSVTARASGASRRRRSRRWRSRSSRCPHRLQREGILAQPARRESGARTASLAALARSPAAGRSRRRAQSPRRCRSRGSSGRCSARRWRRAAPSPTRRAAREGLPDRRRPPPRHGPRSSASSLPAKSSKNARGVTPARRAIASSARLPVSALGDLAHGRVDDPCPAVKRLSLKEAGPPARLPRSRQRRRFPTWAHSNPLCQFCEPSMFLGWRRKTLRRAPGGYPLARMASRPSSRPLGLTRPRGHSMPRPSPSISVTACTRPPRALHRARLQRDDRAGAGDRRGRLDGHVLHPVRRRQG